MRPPYSRIVSQPDLIRNLILFRFRCSFTGNANLRLPLSPPPAPAPAPKPPPPPPPKLATSAPPESATSAAPAPQPPAVSSPAATPPAVTATPKPAVTSTATANPVVVSPQSANQSLTAGSGEGSICVTCLRFALMGSLPSQARNRERTGAAVRCCEAVTRNMASDVRCTCSEGDYHPTAHNASWDLPSAPSQPRGALPRRLRGHRSLEALFANSHCIS